MSHSNLAMLKAMLFNKKESVLAMISATNFGHKIARNQVIIKVVIVVNVSLIRTRHCSK